MHSDPVRLEFETIDCPICGGGSHKALADQDRHGFGLHTVLCERCCFVFTNPMPTNASLSFFYQHNYRHLYRKNSNINVSKLAELGIPERVAATYNYIAKAVDLKTAAAILDFGSADGSLLRHIKDRHPLLHVCGVEPSAEYRSFANSVVQAEFFAHIDDISATRKFDLIVLSHVLEHLAEPLVFLRRLASFLNAGGALYIDVPNLMAYRSYDDLHIAHVGHYSLAVLRNVAALLSLQITHCEEYKPLNHPASLRCIALNSGKVAPFLLTDERLVARICYVFKAIDRRKWLYGVMQWLSCFISVGKLRRLMRRARYRWLQK